MQSNTDFLLILFCFLFSNPFLRVLAVFRHSENETTSVVRRASAVKAADEADTVVTHSAGNVSED